MPDSRPGADAERSSWAPPQVPASTGPTGPTDQIARVPSVGLDAATGHESVRPIRILTVCTANICRSPLAEALLRNQLDGSGRVTSAGVRAAHHLGVDPRSVAFAATRGIDLSTHRARQVTPSLLEQDGADLVLTMTREHLRELALMDDAVIHRVFTLKEFARRVKRTPLVPSASQGWRVFSEALSAQRSTAELLGDDPADDLIDPYGRSDATYQRVAGELADACHVIGAALAVGTTR